MSAELCQEMLFSGRCSKGAACKFSHITEDGQISNPSPSIRRSNNRVEDSSNANKMNSSNETNEIDKIFSSVKPNKDEREHAHSKQQHPSQGNNLKMSNNYTMHGKSQSSTDMPFTKGKHPYPHKNYSKGQPYKSSNPPSSSDTLLNKENDSNQSKPRHDYSKDGNPRSSNYHTNKPHYSKYDHFSKNNPHANKPEEVNESIGNEKEKPEEGIEKKEDPVQPVSSIPQPTKPEPSASKSTTTDIPSEPAKPVSTQPAKQAVSTTPVQKSTSTKPASSQSGKSTTPSKVVPSKAAPSKVTPAKPSSPTPAKPSSPTPAKSTPTPIKPASPTPAKPSSPTPAKPTRTPTPTPTKRTPTPTPTKPTSPTPTPAKPTRTPTPTQPTRTPTPTKPTSSTLTPPTIIKSPPSQPTTIPHSETPIQSTMRSTTPTNMNMNYPHPTTSKDYDTDIMVTSPLRTQPSRYTQPTAIPPGMMDPRRAPLPPSPMDPRGSEYPPRYNNYPSSMSQPHESMQVIPIMPSITVVPNLAYPGSEIEVNIVIRESDYQPDDWIGLFKSFQHQPSKAITQRHACKLHYTRMMSNGEKLKKFTCRFYAPKHGGRYVFRYFHSSDFYSFLNSNEMVVTIRGCDLDEAIEFVEQKINEPSMLTFNINSLYATIQYIIDVENWKHPEKLKTILLSFIEPLYAEKLPETYTTQVTSNLKHLFSSIVQHPFIMSILGEEWIEKLQSLLHHFCHICNIFILDDTEFTKHMKEKHCLPPICKYTPFSNSFLNLLTKQAVKEFRSLCPVEEFYTTREELIQRLCNAFHQHAKYQQAKINIYGSSNNGFGTDGSDIDLCLIDFSIDKDKIFEIADEIVSILESIHMNDIDKSRLHARIPVIRFEDPITKLQCDLCFNNILPIRNTLLLKTYSFIDPRVRVLGIIIKKWAKMNNLNNPIFKTLSSYGYMLMLIHFLQSAVNPPLLPILQKIPPNWNGLPIQGQPCVPTLPVESYEGVVCDTYFYYPRDLIMLKRFAQQNTMTVGELLVNFFYYYGFEYDYIHSVVTIRQRGTLDREEKCCDSLWKMMMQLSIEDPFEIDYDVAHVITPTSSAMIQECFAKSYVMLTNMYQDYKEMDEPDLLDALFKIALYH